MSDHLKRLETGQLRDLVAALSHSTDYWSLESAYNEIGAIGTELLRRETGDHLPERKHKGSVKSQ